MTSKSVEMLMKYFDERFTHLDKGVQEIKEVNDQQNTRLGKMDVTLAKQHEQIVYHIKRTDKIEEDLKPVKGFIDAALKLGGFILFAAGALGGFAEFAHWYSTIGK